jgi:DNA-binding SARP family transcriptional activator
VADLVTVGDGPGALELSRDLAALARRSGSGKLLARAALARAEVYEPTQEFDAPPLLREALAHPEVAADHDLRADLNWGLATLLGIPTVAGPRADVDGARAALAELEALAADGSPLTRFRLLHARLDVESGPLSHRSRQAWFEEADEIAPRPASLVDRLQRGYWGTSLAFESGDLAEVDRRLREWEQLADRSHSSFWRWRAAMARVSHSYATGRFDLAERTLTENADRLANLHPELAGAVQGGLLLTVRRDQGRLGEMFEGVGDGLGVVGVLVAMEHGTPSDVRRQLEPLEAQIEATGPDDLYWLCLMSLVAVGAEAAGDVERCRWVADELEPYRGQMVMWGRSYVFGTPVAEAVGVARRGAGELRRAADAFREAMIWADRAGAPGFAARARVGLASVLPAGEPERERLLADATASATALGLGLVRREIEALDHGPPVRSVRATVLTGTGATTGVRQGPGGEALVPGATASVRTRGRFEVVPAGGPQVARGSSRKARDALKILIARRGRAVPREELIELLWPGVDLSTGRNRLSVVLSMVRSVLDPDKVLPADPLGADRQSVALDLDLVRVDVERFLSAAGAALAGFEAGDLRAARRLAAALDEADDGEFLAEDPYNDFTTGLRSLVRRTRVDVLRALARAADTVGSRAEAIAWLERLVALEPDDVAVRHELVVAYRAEGRHGEARAMLDHGERRRRDLLQ